jgi:hypothetical protein
MLCVGEDISICQYIFNTQWQLSVGDEKWISALRINVLWYMTYSYT